MITTQEALQGRHKESAHHTVAAVISERGDYKPQALGGVRMQRPAGKREEFDCAAHKLFSGSLFGLSCLEQTLDIELR